MKNADATEVVLDLMREERIGIDEAVFAEGKSASQITRIVDAALADRRALFVTRLSLEKRAALGDAARAAMDYCPVSRTAILGELRAVAAGVPRVAIVSAGTSDVPVAREAERTLRYQGHDSTFIADVGIAGLWRLMSRIDEIRAHPIVIVVAGMDAALPTALGGLVGSTLIAVPTSVGYGVAAGGRVALDAILASCAPGVAVLNIDNGYGAACAALRILNNATRLAEAGRTAPTIGETPAKSTGR